MSQDTDNEATSDETASTADAPEAAGDAPEGGAPEAAATEAIASEGSNGASSADEAPAKPTLEEKLELANNEKKALKERMLRVAADFENFRKRSSRELDDTRKRSRQDAVKELLPVFDNLERATAHADQAPDVATIAEGVRMVHKQFLDTLGKLGIERIDASGEPFDPSIHESIQYEHSDEHAAGLVINALQPGYRMGKQLLRPALVVVSRGPAAAEKPEGAGAAEADDAASSDDPASGDDDAS